MNLQNRKSLKQLCLLCCPIYEVCPQHISLRSAEKPVKHSHLSGSMESWSYKTHILYLWSILSELLENIHFPYLWLMLEPRTVKTPVAMGAWLNAVMTQELCWKGGELRFQSLFSSALLGFIRRSSEVKHKQFWAHGPGAKLFQKQNSLSTMTQSQSVLQFCL